MLDDNLRHQITELIRREVIPAVGCTALGDIMAFAVRPDMRGKGIGTALLKTFLSANQADIVKILNVDTRCHTLHTYLTRRNLPVYVRQYEMYKPFR